jgi:predicted anti-sigma-YlaC factor YlaD
MRCEKVDRMLTMRLGGDLNEAEQLQLDDHLRGCSDCRARWRNLQLVDRLLRAAPMKLAPPDLHARVMVRVRHYQHRRGRAIIASAGLALGMVALTLLVLPTAIEGLWGPLGAFSTLVSAGPIMLDQLLSLLNTLARALIVSVGALTLPLTLLCGVVILMTLVLNGLWVRVLRCA